MRRRSELLFEHVLCGAVSAPTPLVPVRGVGAHANQSATVFDASALEATAPPSPRTLKTRAVYYLSKREHSRAELAKKLAQPTYRARQAVFVHKTDLPAAPSAELIETVLDDLQRQGFLDDTRFAQGLARKNANKHGGARVMASLGHHQLDADTTQALAQQLKDTELARCYDVWSRRFAHIDRQAMDFSQSQAALAKQGRFLMQRGFAGDAIKKVLKGWTPELEQS
jgi:regulatory protein